MEKRAGVVWVAVGILAMGCGDDNVVDLGGTTRVLGLGGGGAGGTQEADAGDVSGRDAGGAAGTEAGGTGGDETGGAGDGVDSDAGGVADVDSGAPDTTDAAVSGSALDGGAADGSTDGGVDGGADAGSSCLSEADCDDGNPCTIDTCEPDGSCSHDGTGVFVACDDQSACTTDDVCQGDAGGSCYGVTVSCDDGNACTFDICEAAVGCQNEIIPPGAPCGDRTASECTAPDTCDGAGTCQSNDALPATPCGDAAESECTSADTCDGAGTCQSNDALDGLVCTGGECFTGTCADCADEIHASEFSTTWSTVGASNLFSSACGCDDDEEPDYVVLFTAPATATFRIESGSLGDSLISVTDAACGGAELACSDDFLPPDGDARIDLPMTAGQTVSIVAGALCTTGTGTLSVTQL